MLPKKPTSKADAMPTASLFGSMLEESDELKKADDAVKIQPLTTIEEIEEFALEEFTKMLETSRSMPEDIVKLVQKKVHKRLPHNYILKGDDPQVEFDVDESRYTFKWNVELEIVREEEKPEKLATGFAWDGFDDIFPFDIGDRVRLKVAEEHPKLKGTITTAYTKMCDNGLSPAAEFRVVQLDYKKNQIRVSDKHGIKNLLLCCDAMEKVPEKKPVVEVEAKDDNADSFLDDLGAL